MRANTPLTARVSGGLWLLSGVLLMVMGAGVSYFVASPDFVDHFEYEDLLPIFIVIVVVLLGTGIATILAGYGLLKAKGFAWKAGVSISIIQIVIGMGIIVTIGVVTLFSRLVLLPDPNSLTITYQLQVASIVGLIYTIGGAVLFVSLMPGSLRRSLSVHYERRLLVTLAIVAAAPVAIGFAAVGYGYATEMSGTDDIAASVFGTGGPYDLNIRTETVVDDLGQCGTSFVFVPDGRIFCVEVKSGKVRVIENFRLLPDPMLEPHVYYTTYNEGGLVGVRDERGLTGITIDPDFERNHYVYLHWTYLDSEDNQSYNRVARFTESNNKLSEMKTLVDKIPSGTFHNGGALEFGYDGKLYITGGDAQEFVKARTHNAQDMDSLAGKILRINPDDGTVPQDNPFPGLPYYTMGHRNIFGIGFHPVTKVPYVVENGPECCDEVNILTPGKNYGFPYFEGGDVSPNLDIRGMLRLIKDFPQARERYTNPLLEFTPVIAPTELIFYTGDKYPGEGNNMFFLSYNYRELVRVVLSPPDYDEVLSVERYLLNIDDKPAVYPGAEAGGVMFNSLLDIEQGPDGYLYVSSFNKIMRLHFEYPGPE